MDRAMTIVRYHYLTDAVGGFCVAVAVVLSLAVLLDGRPVGAAPVADRRGGDRRKLPKRIAALVRFTNDRLRHRVEITQRGRMMSWLS